MLAKQNTRTTFFGWLAGWLAGRLAGGTRSERSGGTRAAGLGEPGGASDGALPLVC